MKGNALHIYKGKRRKVRDGHTRVSMEVILIELC